MTLDEIKKRMAALNLSTKQLAEEVQTNYSMLTQVLRGCKPLTPRMTLRIDAALKRKETSGIVFSLPPDGERKLLSYAKNHGLSVDEAVQKILEAVLNITEP